MFYIYFFPIVFIYIISTSPDSGSHGAGFAALAGMLILGISIAALLVSIVMSYFLKQQEGNILIGGIILLASILVLYFSGFEPMFYPMSLGYAISGLLALDESPTEYIS